MTRLLDKKGYEWQFDGRNLATKGYVYQFSRTDFFNKNPIRWQSRRLNRVKEMFPKFEYK